MRKLFQVDCRAFQECLAMHLHCARFPRIIIFNCGKAYDNGGGVEIASYLPEHFFDRIYPLTSTTRKSRDHLSSTFYDLIKLQQSYDILLRAFCCRLPSLLCVCCRWVLAEYSLVSPTHLNGRKTRC